MTIHKEGFPTIALVTMLCLLLGFATNLHLEPSAPILAWVIYIVLLGFWLFILSFFRIPSRTFTYDENSIVSPADGKVVVIEEAFEDEFLKEKRRQVSIFMSPINVHVNRSPIQGTVDYFKYHPGKYLVAWHPKSSTENERTSMVLRDAKGNTMMIRQIAGALARRIKWYVDKGSALQQGEEFGFIKFGSRVDLYLPLDAEILCELGQVTKGARTPIARLK